MPRSLKPPFSSRTAGFPESGWRPWLSSIGLPDAAETQALARIHPSVSVCPPTRYLLEPPTVIGLYVPATGPIDIRHVPRVPLPRRVYSSRVAPHHLAGRYPRFIATTDSCARPSLSHALGFSSRSVGLCRLLLAPDEKWSFPTLSPQSLYRRPDPYPVVPFYCSCPFLPRRLRPHIMVHMFGSPNDPAPQFLQGTPFRGCSHFFIFGLPQLLDPQTAPTASHSGWRPGLIHHALIVSVTHHELWYRYMPESGNWHGRTFTCWIAALSAAPYR